MVAVPEDVQKLLVRDNVGVENNLDSFGVVAEMVIGGIRLGTAGVSHPGANNAVDSPKLGIRTPKSAQSEGSGLHFGGHGGIQRRGLDARG